MSKIAKISALFLGLVTATAALAQNQQNVGPGPQPVPAITTGDVVTGTGSGIGDSAVLLTSLAELGQSQSFTGTNTFAIGTITASATAIDVTGTFNNSSVTFTAPLVENITVTNAAAGSRLLSLQAGASGTTEEFGVTTAGIGAFLGGVTLNGGNFTNTGSGQFLWSGHGILTSPAAGTVQLGAADAASPVAQTLEAQSVVAGNANTAGATLTIAGSKSNGSGGGDMVLQTTLSSASSGTQNTLATAITIKGGTQAVQINQITTGSVANAVCDTSATTLIVDAANCIGSRRIWKQDITAIGVSEAFRDISLLAGDAVDYRYTDAHLSKDAGRPHARDRQPGFIADDLAKMHFVDVHGHRVEYATYDANGIPTGVRYEQISATESVAINALLKEVAADTSANYDPFSRDRILT